MSCEVYAKHIGIKVLFNKNEYSSFYTIYLANILIY